MSHRSVFSRRYLHLTRPKRGKQCCVLDRPRIGEMLLLEERIDPWVLSTALKEQPATRQRLVSLLVHRALLDHDEGAMLLSQQLGYSAAMQRHIERRDPDVLRRVPAEIGARWVVMPLAVSRTGQLIVLARDPTAVLEDFRDGKIDKALARRAYRVVINQSGELDPIATKRLRGAAPRKPTPKRPASSKQGIHPSPPPDRNHQRRDKS